MPSPRSGVEALSPPRRRIATPPKPSTPPAESSVLETMYDDFMTLLQGRESAQRVEVTIGDIDGTVHRVESAIANA